MTLFIQQLGVWEAPAKGDPIGAADDLSPSPEVGATPPGMQSAAYCPQRTRR
jgi:hypothetical protein